MCTKNWLGFKEITQEGLATEKDHFVQYQEVSTDGDVIERLEPN